MSTTTQARSWLSATSRSFGAQPSTARKLRAANSSKQFMAIRPGEEEFMTDSINRSTSGATPKTAIVTGASSGFGQAIAKTFGSVGMAVALVGRSAERLQAVADAINGQGGRA